jgi:hypothetical protein
VHKSLLNSSFSLITLLNTHQDWFTKDCLRYFRNYLFIPPYKSLSKKLFTLRPNKILIKLTFSLAFLSHSFSLLNFDYHAFSWELRVWRPSKRLKEWILVGFCSHPAEILYKTVKCALWHMFLKNDLNFDSPNTWTLIPRQSTFCSWWFQPGLYSLPTCDLDSPLKPSEIWFAYL